MRKQQCSDSYRKQTKAFKKRKTMIQDEISSIRPAFGGQLDKDELEDNSDDSGAERNEPSRAVDDYFTGLEE